MTTTINAASTGLVSTADSSTALAFQTAGTTAVTVDSSQRVGIGNISPTTTLAVTGSTYITGVTTITGNITGGNITTAGIITVNSGAAATAIVNGAGNAVGNIGSSSTYFNQLFAQATTALYADLAEMYESDADYAPGTVVSFGGNKEVTLTQISSDQRVAGVISTNPAHTMNSGIQGEFTVAVALTGRVPTSVIGTVAKGDMMVSAGNGYAQASATPTMGTVIGKALQDHHGQHGIIEIVVGRM